MYGQYPQTKFNILFPVGFLRYVSSMSVKHLLNGLFVVIDLALSCANFMACFLYLSSASGSFSGSFTGSGFATVDDATALAIALG